MKSVYFQLFALLLSSAIFAQNPTNPVAPPDVKFGRINPEDFAPIADFEKDNQAHAIILYDKGTCMNNSANILYYFHKRIKILDKEGLVLANQSIEYRVESETSQELITNLNAYTYNLENGVVRKEKVAKSAIFKDKINERYYRIKFTFPNVRPGSIIEFEYENKSDFLLSLRPWYFQTEKYPILWSEFQLTIPEHWKYNTLLIGFEDFDYTKETMRNAGYKMYENTWAMQNVAPLNENSFTNSLNNYLAHFRFELTALEKNSRYQYSSHKLATSWQTVANNYGGSFLFYGQLLDTKFLDSTITSIAPKNAPPLVQMNSVFDWVKKQMKWNGVLGQESYSTIKEAYKAKIGNVGDINLLLVAALKSAGLKVYPALLSTRDNGLVNENIPSIRAFDYVIAVVQIGTNNYLLDATDRYSQPNILPVRCLNRNALAIKDVKEKIIPDSVQAKRDTVNKKIRVEDTDAGISIEIDWEISVRTMTYEWINTETDERSAISTMYDLALDEKGELSGKLTRRFTFYNAIEERERIHQLKGGEDEYKTSIEKEYTGLSIKKFKLSNLDSLHKPLFYEAEIVIKNKVELANNLMYLPALPYESITQNPFQDTERKTPLIFEYCKKEDTFLKLKLPDNYVIDELPKNESLAMPDGKIVLSANYQYKNNVIELNSKYLRTTTEVPANQYQFLSELYNKMIAKHREQIVLKKKNIA